MDRRFNLVFGAVALITILSGVASGFFAATYGADMPAPLLEFQKQLALLFNAGAGAIIALLAIEKGSQLP